MRIIVNSCHLLCEVYPVLWFYINEGSGTMEDSVTMINGIEEYYQLTKQPWGKLFYETIWEQIDIVNGKTCNILDFGSGFGITAKHYSETHDCL